MTLAIPHHARRVAALGAAAVAALAFAAPAHASFPGANGLIAASGAFGCDDPMVATMQPDGSAFTLLTPSVCDDESQPSYRWPDWSADGQDLFVVDRFGDAVVLEGAAHERRELPLDRVGAPRVSPDGERITYAKQVLTPNGPRTEIWVSAINGLFDMRLRQGSLPRFSPDGKTIAYVAPLISKRNGRECAPGAVTCKGGGIWLMNARTGKNIRRVGPTAGSLDWAPNGKRLLYSPQSRFIGDRLDLFVARADGKGTSRLTRTPNRSESGAVWSPDGKRIAFVARSWPSEETVDQAIYTMSARGGAVTRIYTGGRRRGEDINAGGLAISWQPLR